MGAMGIGHWIVVGAIFLLLFGRGKISEMMGDVAKGIKAFKKGMSEDEAPPAAPSATVPTEPVRTIDHRPVEPVSAGSAGATLADRKVV